MLGLVVAASAVAGVRLLRGPRRVLSPEGRAAQAAVHAVSSTLPVGVVTGAGTETLGDAVLAQPAALSVPLAFATMILVSRADRRRPADVSQHLLALHAPEGLGLARERV